ncbi:relaxase/Mobilization nuclease domain protein, partial [human gut metagenome]
IKQMAAALAYIQDNNLTDYEQLAKKATEAADRFHVISEQVKQTEQAMKTNAGLKAATVQYAKTRPVFEQYKATKYSRKFLAEHEADLELYRAAQAEMRSLLGGAKLPKMDVLKEGRPKLTAKKKQLYGEYQKARRDMQEIVTIKANIDTLMGYTEPGRKQEKER